MSDNQDPLASPILRSAMDFIHSKPTTTQDDDQWNHPRVKKTEDLVINAILAREAYIRRQGGDKRRNIDGECGYPQPASMDARFYQELYDWNEIAARVVEVFPSECWQVLPWIYESEKIEVTTPFESRWKEINQRLSRSSSFNDTNSSVIWNYLAQADGMSGIGRYAVILLGIDDGKDLSQPAEMTDPFPSPGRNNTPTTTQPNVINLVAPTPSGYVSRSSLDSTAPTPITPPTFRLARELLYLRVFPEYYARVIELETDKSSYRYGQPTLYELTLNDPSNVKGSLNTLTGSGTPQKVHWTRVIHIADNHHAYSANESFCLPRCQQVVKRLLDLHKLCGASAEMYWQGALPGLVFKNRPDSPRTNVSDGSLKDEVENYLNGLQRFLRLTNIDADSLAPQVVDPRAQVDVQMESICIRIKMPMRIFKGSERGELASSQDDANWNERKRERQNRYITPRIIVPFVERLMALGVLPVPKEYFVEWPDMTNQTEGERANVAFKKSQALSQYTNSEAPKFVAPVDFLVRVFGLTEQEAQTVWEHAQEYRKEIEEEEKKKREEEFNKQKELMDKQAKANPGQNDPNNPGQNGPPGQNPGNKTPAVKPPVVKPAAPK